MNPQKAPDRATAYAIAVLEQLRDLADRSRGYMERRRADLGNQSHAERREAFAAGELARAEARGYLTALVALNVLNHEDEIAWYEYLNGERAHAPL